MPKSKSTKPKSTTKHASKKSGETKKHAEPATSTQDQTTPISDAAKPASTKPYKSTKPTGLTHKQKAALARQLMLCAGDLMDVPDAKFNDEDLIGIDPKLKGEQLAAWVSYLPGSYWDSRLPQPTRARGRRKI